MRIPVPAGRPARFVVVFVPLAGVAALAVWRGPSADLVGRAFGAVEWRWVAAAVGINLASVAFRAVAWRIVIRQAVPPPWPHYRHVFAAFCIGLLANAAAPGRVGELARVAVLLRHMRRRSGTWAALVGSVFAHRLFDVVVAVPLVVYVLYTARIPSWAETGLAIVVGVGLGFLLAGFLLARRHHRRVDDELGATRRILRMARHGLTVLRRPLAAAEAVVFQVLGWAAQIFAVWAAFEAFGIEAGIPAAALVLVIMNLVILFPLWPGNVGLVQAAVALVLLPYGVAYAHGFAFAIGLHVIEASVGIGLGFAFLAREGFSFARLRRMPDVGDVDFDNRVERVA